MSFAATRCPVRLSGRDFEFDLPIVFYRNRADFIPLRSAFLCSTHDFFRCPTSCHRATVFSGRFRAHPAGQPRFALSVTPLPRIPLTLARLCRKHIDSRPDFGGRSPLQVIVRAIMVIPGTNVCQLEVEIRAAC